MSNRRRVGSWAVGADRTPVRQHIPAQRANRFPEMVPREHLWTLVAAYQVSADLAARIEAGSGEKILMDAEALLTIQGPGCMWCEQEYTKAVAARPCPGDASA